MTIAKHPPVGALLTPREVEVLAYLAKGCTNEEIAIHAEGIKKSTVVDYLKKIFVKLDVNSRAEAAVRACEMGLHGTPAAACDPLPELLMERLLLEEGHEVGAPIDADLLRRYSNRLAAEIRRTVA